MYNNSDPYARNELPNNMLSQVSLSANNNALDFNIMGKQARVPGQKGAEGFNMHAFSQFGQVPMGFEGATNPYLPSQHYEQRNDEDQYSDEAPETMHAGLNFVAVDVPKFKLDRTPSPLADEQQDHIQVKMEPASWADTDYQQPFVRDSGGVSGLDKVDGEVAYSECSVERARECVRNGSSSALYFECPSCALLLRHPKRFLVHVAWHAFGQTRAARARRQTELEAARQERRAARLAERWRAEEAPPGAAGAGAGAFPCKDCDKVFLARPGLKKHRAKEHPVKMTECKVCLAPVAGLADFRAHMDTHTSKDRETQKYQCPECPKKYKFSHSLYKHIDTHLEKKHQCSLCDKKFGSAAQRARHMGSHARRARGAAHHCAYCGKGYYDAFTLQIHERIHTNERPFVCEICKSAFQTNSSLKRHTRVSHNSTSEHVCATCQRSFTTPRSLTRHALRAHSQPDQFQYPCKLCDKRYFKSKDLRNHMYKIHARRMKDPPSETD